MSVSAGGEVKAVLSLDIEKFQTNLEKATSGLTGFDKTLKSAAKVTEGFEKGVKGMASDMGAVSERFKMLDKTIEAFGKHLTGVVSGIENVSKRTRAATSDMDAFGAAAKRTTSINATEWLNKYAGSVEKLAPAIKKAVSSMAELDRAYIASTANSKVAADATAKQRLAALASERETNSKIIAERQKTIAELARIQEVSQKYGASGARVTEKFNANTGKTSYTVRDAQNSFISKNSEAGKYAIAAHVATQEQKVIQSIVQELKWKNGELSKSITLLNKETAIAEKVGAANVKAAKMAQEAHRGQIGVAQQVANERISLIDKVARHERQAIAANTDMIKNMVGMWAAYKGKQGIEKAIHDTGEQQQAELRLKALNLPTAEYEEFKKKAFDLSRENKYLSFTESLNARLTALTSIGHNDPKKIDATIGSAVQVAQSLKMGGAAGRQQDIISNLYGVAEMRQVINDPEATKRTFELLNKSFYGSNGKITIADFETALRNLGSGAQLMSDDGMYRIMALMEQMKVSGGQHGSGAAAGTGVSSIGTMLKMSQLYASGKPVSDTLLQQLVGAGIMDVPDSVTNAKGGRAQHKAIMRAMKTAGFNDADKVMSDPTQALWEMRAPIMEFMKGSEENRKLYFGKNELEKDMSVEQEMMALQKFWARSGFSNKAVSMNMMAQDPRAHARAEHVAQLAKNSKGSADVLSEAGPTWEAAVLSFKKGASDLATSFEPFVKQVSSAVNMIGEFLSAAGKFARDNPLVGNIAITAAALATLSLGFKTMMGITGNAGASVGSVLKQAVLGTTELTAAQRAQLPLGQQIQTVSRASAATVIAELRAKEQSAAALKNHTALRVQELQATVAATSGFSRLSVVQRELIPAQQAATTAAAAHAVEQGKLTTAQAANTVGARALTGATNLLKGGLSLIGGPLGAIAVGLQLGASLWETYGNKAGIAADKALRASEAMVANLDNEIQLLHQRNRLMDAGGNVEVANKESIEAGIKSHKANAKDAKDEAWRVLDPRQGLKGKESYLNANLGYRLFSAAVLAYRSHDQGEKAERGEKNAKEYDQLSGVLKSKEALQKANIAQEEDAKLFAQVDQDITTERIRGKRQKAESKVNSGFELPKGGANARDKTAHSFDAAFAEWQRQNEMSKEKLASLISGEESVQKQADIAITALFKKGELNDKSGKALFDAKYDANGRVSGIAENTRNKDLLDSLKQQFIEAKRTESAIADLTFARQRSAAAAQNEEQAYSDLEKNGLAKTTDSMKALLREFARYESKATKDGVPVGADFIKEKNKAIASQAFADLATGATDYSKRTTEAETQLQFRADGSPISERDRLKADWDAKLTLYRADMDARLSAADNAIRLMDKESDEYKKKVAERQEAETKFTNFMNVQERLRTEAMLSPLDKMAAKWKDLDGAISEMETSWADGMIDNMHKALTGQKADWKGLVLNIGNDISKALLKESMGGFVRDIVKSIGSFAKQGGSGENGGFGGLLSSALSWLGLGGSKSASGAAKGVASQVAETSIKSLGATTDVATSAVQEMTQATSTYVTDGLTKTIAATSQEILGKASQQTATNMATTALWNLSSAANAASVSMGGSSGGSLGGLGSLFGGGGGQGIGELASVMGSSGGMENLAYFAFANGGIMTDEGSIPLRKYASGGVANSAQAAVFGEGSTPEAFVPLPDGRSIPVTMQGGSSNQTGETVIINITVNEGDGSEKTDSAGSDDATWREMAERIKGLVCAELVTQKRPGGVLY